MATVTGTCKLCRTKDVSLQNSHFIPAGAYKAIQRSMDQPPVVIKSSITIKKNEQVTDYVLCADCEQCFSRNGEAWVMSHCNQPGSGFRLKEIVDGLTPVEKGDRMTFYSAAGVTEIDVEKITYFVSSILWRGSAHRWRSGKDPVNSPNLGPYEEELRRYLLGETGFPKNAVIWISLVTDPNLWVSVNFPYGEKIRAGESSCWRYKFLLHGLSFMFFLGKEIDPIIRRSCSYRSPEKFIFSGNKTNEMIVFDFGRTIAKSKPVGSLRKPRGN